MTRSGVYLLLGTNEGDRLQNLATATAWITEKIGNVLRSSGIYQTEAWGKTDQPVFYNQVIEIQTDLPATVLLSSILSIENQMGRVRKEKWGARIIDIDILFYHDLVVNDASLTIPHPGIPERRFCLVPLNEIAPELIHPVLKINVSSLLESCGDTLEVKAVG